MSETDEPRKLIWTENEGARQREKEHKTGAYLVRHGAYSYHYQESSSWFEAGLTSYDIIAAGPYCQSYLVLFSTYQFNNDGMSAEDREEYEGDAEETLSPYLYGHDKTAQEAVEFHFASGRWLNPDELANRRAIKNAGVEVKWEIVPGSAGGATKNAYNWVVDMATLGVTDLAAPHYKYIVREPGSLGNEENHTYQSEILYFFISSEKGGYYSHLYENRERSLPEVQEWCIRHIADVLEGRTR